MPCLTTFPFKQRMDMNEFAMNTSIAPEALVVFSSVIVANEFRFPLTGTLGR